MQSYNREKKLKKKETTKYTLLITITQMAN